MDEDLIIRYLQRRLTEEESHSFKLWLSENPENRKLFKTYKQVWALNTGMIHLDNADAEREFNSFKYRYLLSANTKSSIFNSWHFQVLKYAAVFLLAFVLSFYFYKTGNKEKISLQASFNEIITKPGERSQIRLADGSKIWINSCTRLKYPVNLTSGQIDLYLEGEAYFDLKRIPNRKITVHTSGLNIKVLGTAFNLRSYPDDDIIETTLVRGKIAIENSSGKNHKAKQILLSPNQSAIYFKNSNLLEASTLAEHRIQTSETQERLEQLAIKNQSNLIVEESIDTESHISWIEGKMVFRKETFEKLSNRLMRRYNVKITISDEQLKKARLSGTFDKESIEQVLKALSYPVPFNYRIIKDSIIILPK